MSSGMSLKTRIDLAETVQFFDVKIARAGKTRVEDRRDMSIGEKENVFVVPLHMKMGVMMKYFEVESCKEFGAAERSAGVTARCSMDHPDDVPPDLGGDVL